MPTKVIVCEFCKTKVMGNGEARVKVKMRDHLATHDDVDQKAKVDFVRRLRVRDFRDTLKP